MPAKRGIPRPAASPADPLAPAFALGRRLGDRAVHQDVARQSRRHRQAGGEDGSELPRALEPAVVPVELQAQGVLDLGGRRTGEPARAHAGTGERGQSVDVVAGEAGIGDGAQAGLDGEVELAAPQPPSDGGLADARDDRPALEALGRAHGAGTRAACAPGAGRNSGSQTSSACSKVTSTAMPIVDVVGFAVHEVRREPDVVLLGDGDQPDHVGVRPRDPLLVVDGERVHHAVAAHRPRGPACRRGSRGRRGDGGCT